VLEGDDAESLPHNRTEVPVKFLVVVADEDVSRCQFGGIAVARKYQSSASECT
jgi:hypothetical protein